MPSNANNARNAQACGKNTNTGLQVCPITMKNVESMDKTHVFAVGNNDPTVYDVEALYTWIKTLESQGKPFTYPHNRQRIPIPDVDRIIRMMRVIHTRMYTTTTAPSQSNGRIDLASQIMTETLNPVPNDLNDPRLSRYTYHGQPLVDYIRNTIPAFLQRFAPGRHPVYEFDSTTLENVIIGWLKGDAVVGTVKRVWITFAIQGKYVNRSGSWDDGWHSVMIQYNDWDAGFPINTFKERRHAVNYFAEDDFFDKLLFKSPLMELSQLGGKSSTHVTYKGRKYKVRTGARGGKYIVVQGEKKYI